MDPSRTTPVRTLRDGLPFSTKALLRSSPRSVEQATFALDRDGDTPLAVPEPERFIAGAPGACRARTLEHHAGAVRAIERRGRSAAPDMKLPIANADEVLRPDPGSAHEPAGTRSPNAAPRHPRFTCIIPKSRDFH